MTKQLKTKHERENKYQTWTVKQLSPPSKKEKKGKRVSKQSISAFPFHCSRCQQFDQGHVGRGSSTGLCRQCQASRLCHFPRGPWAMFALDLTLCLYY